MAPRWGIYISPDGSVPDPVPLEAQYNHQFDFFTCNAQMFDSSQWRGNVGNPNKPPGWALQRHVWVSVGINCYWVPPTGKEPLPSGPWADSFDAVANGMYDSDIANWITVLSNYKAEGGQVMAQFHLEPELSNQGGFVGTAPHYKAAFAHILPVFRAAGVPLGWDASSSVWRNGEWTQWEPTDYDTCSADFYPATGDPTKTLQWGLGAFFDNATNNHPGRPVIVRSMSPSLLSDSQAATWFTEASDLMLSVPDFFGVGWDLDNQGLTDMNPANFPLTKAAFKAAATNWVQGPQLTVSMPTVVTIARKIIRAKTLSVSLVTAPKFTRQFRVTKPLALVATPVISRATGTLYFKTLAVSATYQVQTTTQTVTAGGTVGWGSGGWGNSGWGGVVYTVSWSSTSVTWSDAQVTWAGVSQQIPTTGSAISERGLYDGIFTSESGERRFAKVTESGRWVHQVTGFAYTRALVVTSPFVVGLKAQTTNRSMPVTLTATPQITRQIRMTLSVTTSMVAGVAKGPQVHKTFALTPTYAATLTPKKILHQTLAVTATFTPVSTSRVGISLPVDMVAEPAYVRAIASTLAVTTTLTPAISQTTSLVRAVTLAVSTTYSVQNIVQPQTAQTTALSLDVSATFTPEFVKTWMLELELDLILTPTLDAPGLIFISLDVDMPMVAEYTALQALSVIMEATLPLQIGFSQNDTLTFPVLLQVEEVFKLRMRVTPINSSPIRPITLTACERTPIHKQAVDDIAIEPYQIQMDVVMDADMALVP